MEEKILTHFTEARRELEAEIFKALAHPVRLGIFEYLQNREKCVCEIFPHLGMEQSHLSKHLAILRKAGILDVRREGKKIFYRVKNRQTEDLLICVKKVLSEGIKEKQKLLKEIKTGGKIEK